MNLSKTLTAFSLIAAVMAGVVLVPSQADAAGAKTKRYSAPPKWGNGGQDHSYKPDMPKVIRKRR